MDSRARHAPRCCGTFPGYARRHVSDDAMIYSQHCAPDCRWQRSGVQCGRTSGVLDERAMAMVTGVGVLDDRDRGRAACNIRKLALDSGGICRRARRNPTLSPEPRSKVSADACGHPSIARNTADMGLCYDRPGVGFADFLAGSLLVVVGRQPLSHATSVSIVFFGSCRAWPADPPGARSRNRGVPRRGAS